MSTRSMTEFHFDWDKRTEPGALLYHHSDGYPDFMLPKVIKFLRATAKALKDCGYPYWWDPERVAAFFVLFSANGYSEPTLLTPAKVKVMIQVKTAKGYSDKVMGYPQFQPATDYHCDIEYLYRVFFEEESKLGQARDGFYIQICTASIGDRDDTKEKVEVIGEFASSPEYLTGKYPVYTEEGKVVGALEEAVA